LKGEGELKNLGGGVKRIEFKAAIVICFTIEIEANRGFVADGFNLMDGIGTEAENVAGGEKAIACCRYFVWKFCCRRSLPKSILLVYEKDSRSR
jgi:hypothetical protein